MEYLGGYQLTINVPRQILDLESDDVAELFLVHPILNDVISAVMEEVVKKKCQICGKLYQNTTKLNRFVHIHLHLFSHTCMDVFTHLYS